MKVWSSTLKTEATGFSETLVSAYKTTRGHNPQEYNPNFNRVKITILYFELKSMLLRVHGANITHHVIKIVQKRIFTALQILKPPDQAQVRPDTESLIALGLITQRWNRQHAN
jgi:hypothetical protein